MASSIVSPFSRLQIGAHIVEVAKKGNTVVLSSCIPMQPFFEFSFSFAAADPLEFSMFPREKSESEALSN